MESTTSVKTSEESRAAPAQEANRHSWEAFNQDCFEVQKILDENKLLIAEINQNHESRMPENLTRNVALIQELKNNVNRVAGLYSDLSSTFVNFMKGEVKQKSGTITFQKPSAMLGQKRTRAD
ncbi:hypothetical protein KP509_02G006700 [Ceratopteris richardii]|uniref:Protein EARLY FLOWERING 4 domain-containing protein n=1 Tax=Ceratopteris richardii TaxID=49495 RepID=A0A8T2V363_CERRI|nr:hypothetical protein KP509_02G006700 [Ceratopteris richardii]KAH7442901.1 hypothetical protein KP509_02G006700 [Ceratopteris richardii]